MKGLDRLEQMVSHRKVVRSCDKARSKGIDEYVKRMDVVPWPICTRTDILTLDVVRGQWTGDFLHPNVTPAGFAVEESIVGVRDYVAW